MTSEIEKKRQVILEQLNNLGRVLEARSPEDALELKRKLSMVTGWLAARVTQPVKPRRAKGSGR